MKTQQELCDANYGTQEIIDYYRDCATAWKKSAEELEATMPDFEILDEWPDAYRALEKARALEAIVKG